MRVLFLLCVLGLLALAPTGLLDKPFYAFRLMLMDAPLALPVPIANVGSAALADSWGAPRGYGRKHQGIDIFAPRGTPVLSTTEGVVWRLGENRLGGTVVWVMGPGRQLHYYAHLDSIALIGIGDTVLPGDVLGYVGNTGNARTTPSHLHYGIYTAGGAINPYPLLRNDARAADAAEPLISTASPAGRGG